MINFADIALTRFLRLRRLMDQPVAATPVVEQEPAPFFTVWRPLGGQPTKRHDTRGNAEHEAERIARMYPGQDVFVMVPSSRVKAARVEREDFTRLHGPDCMCARCRDYDDGVPF
ncbi:hypothetical protein ASE85_02345 [Sphingobium sp. Leaf26]|uniref:hypothetical protein n=1 Tax=Sphingobium sp. Leaf26 TaxID=1735693 RepID=UPI000713F604|nr:hypothetical protein [Sphingobium sp. Leaf26]KQN09800.1 hypothetical protein ASE85_02345 [Sphingobium sp. Leaf26]